MDCISVKIVDKLKDLEDMNPPNYDELARYYLRLFEYHLRLMFACLWDRKANKMPTKKYLDIVQKMSAPTYGTEWGIVKEMNEMSEPLFTFDKKYKTLLDNFVKLRNKCIGHGTLDYETFCRELGNLKWYQNLNKFEKTFWGDDCEFLLRPYHVEQGQVIVFQSNQNQHRDVEKNIAAAYQQNALYFHCNAGYFKVSPFLILVKRSKSDYDFYYFHQYDYQSGIFDYYYMPEIKNENLSKTFPDFFNSYRQQIDKQTIRYVNGIIANDFENNYDYFFSDIKPVNKYFTQIWASLINAQSNTCIIIRGGGGVGKTALVQYICAKLLQEITDKPKFNYVIFCSAKTKEFRLNLMTERGQVYPVDADKIIGSYKEILRTACKVLGIAFEGDAPENISKIEEAILEKKGVLFIIDNFETLPDAEKEKVVNLINRMKIGRHKVLITTRLKDIVGLKISAYDFERMNEEQVVAFIKERLKRIPKNSKALEKFQKLLAQKAMKRRIYNATKGLPLLAIQLAALMQLKDFSEKLLPEEKNISEECGTFLIERLDEHFTTPTIKLLFLLIALFNKWDLQNIPLPLLKSFYDLYCKRLEISGGDFATDLKEIAFEDIIKIENDSVSLSNYSSDKIVEQCAKKFLAEYPNRFFDERLFKLATTYLHDKWIMYYFKLPDALIDDAMIDIFALENVCELTGEERLQLIEKFIEKCNASGDEEKIVALQLRRGKYFDNDKNHSALFDGSLLPKIHSYFEEASQGLFEKFARFRNEGSSSVDLRKAK